MVPPLRLTGTIRKSTRRTESTREMLLSWSGVEWRAETGEVANVLRAAVTYLAMAVPCWERMYRGSDPAMRSGRSSPSVSIVLALKRAFERHRFSVSLERNVPQRRGDR